MKTVVINLTAIERINAVPLRQALDLYNKAVAGIALERERFAALKQEVSAFVADTNPSDAKRVGQITAKQMQLDMFPGFIARCEQQIGDTLIPALERHAEDFRAALVRFYNDAHEAAATQLADLFRPYFSHRVVVGDRRDTARDIALQSDLCQGIYDRREQAGGVRWSTSSRSNNPESYDRDLAEAAQKLLNLASKS